jgi:hypothetical protein
LRDILREEEYRTGTTERRNLSCESAEKEKATPEEQEQVVYALTCVNVSRNIYSVK